MEQVDESNHHIAELASILTANRQIHTIEPTKWTMASVIHTKMAKATHPYSTDVDNLSPACEESILLAIQKHTY
jgi:hypothetical protein